MGIALSTDGCSVFVSGNLQNPLNQRWHWAERARWAKRWRVKTALLVRSEMNQRKWSSPASMPKRVIVQANVRRLFDPDGLVAALKPVVDGLRDAGLIHDDGPRSGHDFPPPSQVVVAPKERGIWVRVEAIT